MNPQYVKIFFVSLIFIILTGCKKSKNSSKLFFEEEKFTEQIINFKPEQREGVSEKEFTLGKVRFENAVKRIKKDSFRLASNDYWDLTLAQISLREPEFNIRYTFFKAYELDPKTICFVLQIQKTDAIEGFQRIVKIIPESLKIVDTCKTNESTHKENMNPKDYSKKNNLDSELVVLFHEMESTDQKYRVDLTTHKEYKNQQDEIDNKNQIIVDSLYAIHKEYIGHSYVGDRYKDVMWLVIQHSNLETIKKYLPIIYQVVKKGNLTEGNLQLLVDRMYHLEYGYQIFGTQAGVEIAPDDLREKVMNTFAL